MKPNSAAKCAVGGAMDFEVLVEFNHHRCQLDEAHNPGIIRVVPFFETMTRAIE